MSVTDITSCSRLGRAFRCSTFAPSRTGSVQARTPGAPSTATRQFGQWPEQHISPRRRWYLKLRENVRWPAAYSAEPIVSPSSARDLLAVEGERDRPVAVDQLGRLRREAGHPSSSPGKPDLQHLVRARVALGQEPRPAARAVVPPLALHARDVAAEVVVLAELAERRGLPRARCHLAAEREVGHLADAAVRTRQGRTTCGGHRRQSVARIRNTIADGATDRRPVRAVASVARALRCSRSCATASRASASTSSPAGSASTRAPPRGCSRRSSPPAWSSATRQAPVPARARARDARRPGALAARPPGARAADPRRADGADRRDRDAVAAGRARGDHRRLGPVALERRQHGPARPAEHRPRDRGRQGDARVRRRSAAPRARPRGVDRPHDHRPRALAAEIATRPRARLRDRVRRARGRRQRDRGAGVRHVRRARRDPRPPGPGEPARGPDRLLRCSRTRRRS